MLIGITGRALYLRHDPYETSDAVFGVKESLVVQFERHPAGAGPDGERLDTPFYTVSYDFRLRPAAAAAPDEA